MSKLILAAGEPALASADAIQEQRRIGAAVVLREEVDKMRRIAALLSNDTVAGTLLIEAHRLEKRAAEMEGAQ